MIILGIVVGIVGLIILLLVFIFILIGIGMVIWGILVLAMYSLNCISSCCMHTGQLANDFVNRICNIGEGTYLLYTSRKDHMPTPFDAHNEI